MLLQTCQVELEEFEDPEAQHFATVSQTELLLEGNLVRGYAILNIDARQGAGKVDLRS